jgi:mono/diheme cytochrome c family protein
LLFLQFQPVLSPRTALEFPRLSTYNGLGFVHVQGFIMRSHRIVLILILSAFCGLAPAVAAQEASVPKVTYNKDVAPILFKNCVVCHRPNDIAPMSLMTYKDTRMWARPIRDAVVNRKMPPWHVDPKVGDFINDPRLTDTEIATIDSWVRTGAQEGDAKDLPPAPVFAEGWHIKPDVVLTIPEFLVSGSTMDDYEYIYVPTNFTEDKWIQAAEVMPGDRRVVHHATVSVIAASEVAKKEAENVKSDAGEDKYHYRTGRVLHIRKDAPVINDGCSSPDGGGVPGEPAGYVNIVPGIYLPGHLAETRPPGFALRIPAGSYLQFQVHYSNHSGENVKDRTSIGLVFAKEPVKHEIGQYEIWNNLFLIPPNADNQEVTSCFTLPKDVTVVAYTAHMHFRGKDMKTEAIYPDGRHEVILNVPHYDFRWQETYFLKKQFLLPKGTELVTTAHFDNSLNNPQNPDPSKAIRWGEPSDEEMMGFWLQFADPKLVDAKPAVAQK